MDINQHTRKRLSKEIEILKDLDEIESAFSKQSKIAKLAPRKLSITGGSFEKQETVSSNSERQESKNQGFCKEIFSPKTRFDKSVKYLPFFDDNDSDDDEC